MTIQIDISRFKNLALEAQDDGVWVVTLNRPTKRNALDIDTIEELVEFFSLAPRAGVRAVVLAGAGDHFCAGLDLIEHHDEDRSPADFMHVCLRWHEAFNKMEYGGVRLKTVAYLERTRIPVTIDIGFGDAMADATQRLDYPTLLDLPAPQVRSYPPATVIAEKFQAMVALGGLFCASHKPTSRYSLRYPTRPWLVFCISCH